MKNRYRIIQIVPSDSGKTHIFKVHAFIWKTFGILLVLCFLFGGFLLYKLTAIDAMLVASRHIQAQNEKLIEKQKEYEAFFAELDSISTMEKQIKNILGTFYETDSTKLSAIIEKNHFNFSPMEKNTFNSESQSWNTEEKRKNWSQIPNIMPTIGIISKHFSEEESHLGIDISTKINEPVFATADGKVLSVSRVKDRGLNLQIDHGNGYVTSYSHLKKNYVKKNRPGATGNATGSHIHYEITKDNQHIDPELFIEE